jgi:hypothetical protein
MDDGREADRQTGRFRPADGRELIDRAFTEHMRNERRLLDCLTPADAAQLESLLTRWLVCFETPLEAQN